MDARIPMPHFQYQRQVAIELLPQNVLYYTIFSGFEGEHLEHCVVLTILVRDTFTNITDTNTDP